MHIQELFINLSFRSASCPESKQLRTVSTLILYEPDEQRTEYWLVILQVVSCV